MLSQSQFYKLQKLLNGNIRQVECPCGDTFFTLSTKAIYHSNSCRQRFFREKAISLAEINKTFTINKNNVPNLLTQKTIVKTVEPKTESETIESDQTDFAANDFGKPNLKVLFSKENEQLLQKLKLKQGT